MSVNGLGSVSRARKDAEEATYPSNLSAIVYTMWTNNVINKPAGRSYLQK